MAGIVKKWAFRSARAVLTFGLAYTGFDASKLTWPKFSVWMILLVVLFLVSTGGREESSPTKS